MEGAALSLWTEMGWIGIAIVATLFIMSVAAGTIAFKKWRTLRKSFRDTRAFARGFERALADDEIEVAIGSARRHGDSHVARVLGQALSVAAPMMRRGDRTHDVVEWVERVIEREQILLALELKKGLGFLATVGATAPLVAEQVSTYYAAHSM